MHYFVIGVSSSKNETDSVAAVPRFVTHKPYLNLARRNVITANFITPPPIIKKLLAIFRIARIQNGGHKKQLTLTHARGFVYHRTAVIYTNLGVFRKRGGCLVKNLWGESGRTRAFLCGC